MKPSTKTLLAHWRVEAVGESRRAYIPGAGHDWWLPLHDVLLKLLGPFVPMYPRLLRRELMPLQHVILHTPEGAHPFRVPRSTVKFELKIR